MRESLICTVNLEKKKAPTVLARLGLFDESGYRGFLSSETA